jgi:hypothetical protein
VAAARNVRRLETLIILAALANPLELSHDWLAERSGLPLGYLRWRYPTVADLEELGLIGSLGRAAS